MDLSGTVGKDALSLRGLELQMEFRVSNLPTRMILRIFYYEGLREAFCLERKKKSFFFADLDYYKFDYYKLIAIENTKNLYCFF